jgi:hypothetical protein
MDCVLVLGEAMTGPQVFLALVVYVVSVTVFYNLGYANGKLEVMEDRADDEPDEFDDDYSEPWRD